jgi:hypothetical protein
VCSSKQAVVWRIPEDGVWPRLAPQVRALRLGFVEKIVCNPLIEIITKPVACLLAILFSILLAFSRYNIRWKSV